MSSLQRVLLTAGGSAVAAVILGACGSHDCASVDYTSGIGVELQGAGWSVSEFCVDDECAPSTSGRHLFLAVDDEPEDYSYRLLLSAPDGTDVRRTGSVRTQGYRHNGSGCDPLTANAKLIVDEEGEVIVGLPDS